MDRRPVISQVTVWAALLSVLVLNPLAGFSETATESPRLVTLEGLGVQLAVPGGWTVQNDPEGRGALLLPAEPGFPPVELVAWSTPDRQLTAEKAAAGHESLLAQKWTYQRRQARSFTTRVGKPALEVAGEIVGDDEIRYRCIFAAYTLAERYYVLGTFYRPDQEAAVRAIFEPLMRSLQLAGETVQPSLPAPAKPPQPEPVPQPPAPEAPPQPPAPEAPPQPPAPEAPPVPPEPMPPPPPPVPEPLPALNLTQEYLEAGLSVKLPEAWQARVGNGVFHAHDREAIQGIFVWPVLSKWSKLEAPPHILAGWQRMSQVTFIERNHRRETLAPGAVYLATGDLTVAERSASTAVAIYMGDGIALLTAAYAPADDFAQMMPDLAAILGTVALEPRDGTVATDELRAWSTADGLLTVQTPPGWKMRGRIRKYNGRTVIDLEGELEGPPRLKMAWRQPYVPFFRELTPLLRGLGRREGEQYRDYRDESPLEILSPRAPEDFVTSYLLPRAGLSARNIVISRRVSFPAASDLIATTAGEGAIVEVADSRGDGAGTQTYLVATGEVPIAVGSFRWQAGYLMWAGTAASAAQALRALRTVVQTASASTAHELGRSATDLITKARKVLEEAEEMMPAPPASLLTPPFRPSVVGGIVVPEQAGKCWREPRLYLDKTAPVKDNGWWQGLR